MTVKSDQRKIIYSGNGVTTQFAVPFYFINNADVQVSVNDGTTTTDLVLGTDYTLTGAGVETGGTLTTVSPVASGSEIALLRTVAYKQEMDIPENDIFPSQNMERALDRLTMQTQQLAEQVSRSVTVDVFSDTDPSELVNEIEVIYDHKDEVIAVAGSITDVQNVSADLTNVDIVATNISDVNTVAGDISNVNIVAGDETNVDTVATYMSSVRLCADDIENVRKVGVDISNVVDVAGDLTNIDTVAGIASDVSTVAGISADVSAVAAIDDKVTAVAGNATNINTVAGDKTNIDTVAGISSSVSTVAGASSNVSTVATNISDVNNAATHMADIQAAPGAASAAATSEANAETWAEGSDADVSALGGTHSAKGWADAAETIYNNIDAIVDDAAETLSERLNTPFFFGQSTYSDVVPDNASWLASNGSYNARSVYPDYYDWLLTHIGETITANGGKVVLSTGTYTDYDFVVNQNDQTFRLPLLDGSESLMGNVYEDLTLQASGSEYQIAKNGTLFLSKNATGDGQYIQISNGMEYPVQRASTSNHNLTVMLDFKRGQTAVVNFNAAGTTNAFRFIPAVGNGTLYYYVGDTVQDASLINAGAVLGQLANKADIDASNFNAVGRSYLSGLSNPSTQGINLVATGAINTNVTTTAQTYIAPASGVIQISGVDANYTLLLCNSLITRCGSGAGSVIYAHANVSKGDTVYIRTDTGTATLLGATFRYANGEV